MSSISNIELKKGQFFSISIKVLLNFFIYAYLKASALPNHAGNINLICVHANTQGIALKLLILSTFFLFDGLDPIDNFPSAALGVTVLKYLIKSAL